MKNDTAEPQGHFSSAMSRTEWTWKRYSRSALDFIFNAPPRALATTHAELHLFKFDLFRTLNYIVWWCSLLICVLRNKKTEENRRDFFISIIFINVCLLWEHSYTLHIFAWLMPWGKRKLQFRSSLRRYRCFCPFRIWCFANLDLSASHFATINNRILCWWCWFEIRRKMR